MKSLALDESIAFRWVHWVVKQSTSKHVCLYPSSSKSTGLEAVERVGGSGQFVCLSTLSFYTMYFELLYNVLWASVQCTLSFYTMYFELLYNVLWASVQCTLSLYTMYFELLYNVLWASIQCTLSFYTMYFELLYIFDPKAWWKMNKRKHVERHQYMCACIHVPVYICMYICGIHHNI